MDQEDFDEKVLEEKMALIEEALNTIEDVIESLAKEAELHPVTIIGITMTPELLGAAFSFLTSIVFLTLSSATGSDIASPI
jgi:hypothetical protein